MPYEGIYDEKFEERCERKIQEMKLEEELKPYIIVVVWRENFEKGTELLVKRVNEKKKLGYVCAGGHVITRQTDSIYYFSQAMELKK